MGEMPFMDRIYLGPDTAKELVVYPGEGLNFFGTSPVASADRLRITLICAGRLPVILNPAGTKNTGMARIKLPTDLEAGDWEVIVSNLDLPATVTLPIKLRLVKQN